MLYFNKFRIPITVLAMVMLLAYLLMLCFGFSFCYGSLINKVLELKNFIIIPKMLSYIFSEILPVTECVGLEDKNNIKSFNKALEAEFPDLKIKSLQHYPISSQPSVNANTNLHLNIDLGTVAIVTAGTALTNAVPRQSKSITAGATLFLGFINHTLSQKNRHALEMHKVDMFYKTQMEMYKLSLNNKLPSSPPSPPDMLPSPLEKTIIPPISVDNMNLHEIIVNTAQWLDFSILGSLFFLIGFAFLHLLSSPIIYEFFMNLLQPWPNLKSWVEKIMIFRRFVNEVLRMVLLLTIIGMVYHCHLFYLVLMQYMELGHFVANTPALDEYLKNSRERNN